MAAILDFWSILVNFTNMYKTANNGRILDFKVAIEAYGHSASNYCFRIFKKLKIKLKKTHSSNKSRTYIRRPQIKKFYKRDTPKSRNSDSKYNFQIFKNQK